MAGLRLIFFGLFIVTCSAHFGYKHKYPHAHHDEGFPRQRLFKTSPKPQSPMLNSFRRQSPILKRVQPSSSIFKSFQPQSPAIKPYQPEAVDKKCYTLARRPFYVTRLVQHPCYKRMNGPVVRSFMSREGPICMSHIRVPVNKFYRIPVCCPGFTDGRNGKCYKKQTQSRIMMPRVSYLSKMRNSRPTYPKMMSMAASMQRNMWVKAKQEMVAKKANLMAKMRQQRMMMPRRTPFSPFGRISGLRQQPKITFLRFKRPSTLPMPHPVQRPPLKSRMIRITSSRMLPMQRFNFPSPPRMTTPFTRRTFRPMSPRQPPRMILSGRSQRPPFQRMQQFHPTPQFQPMRRMAIPRMPMRMSPEFPMSRGFPNIPQPPRGNMMNHFGINENNRAPPEFPMSRGFPNIPQPPRGNMMNHFGINENNRAPAEQFPQIPERFEKPSPQEAEMSPETIINVALPENPVEMPEPIVEQTPSNEPSSCIVQLEASVKNCLNQNNIDVPNVMSAFEPFNDDMSRILCQSEDAIFQCISESLKDCNQSNDAIQARDMLMETADTVKSMCEMRAASVVKHPEPQPEITSKPTLDFAPSNSGADVQNMDTQATVENVDDIPMDSRTTDILVQDQAHDHAMPNGVQEAIKSEVHVQELDIREYYIPILVGSGVGFIILVLVISLVMCCCCKRKLRRKMKMAREWEKPPLKDGIYTIGVNPPVYETNGIPPGYYEENKGEKITSRSPSVVSGTDDEEPTKTQM